MKVENLQEVPMKQYPTVLRGGAGGEKTLNQNKADAQKHMISVTAKQVMIITCRALRDLFPKANIHCALACQLGPGQCALHRENEMVKPKYVPFCFLFQSRSPSRYYKSNFSNYLKVKAKTLNRFSQTSYLDERTEQYFCLFSFIIHLVLMGGDRTNHLHPMEKY